MGALSGKVAVVTGATRGCGRGIAVELGAAGATVYAAGRTTRERQSPMGRPETIEETADLVTAAGGHGIPVRCDFTKAADVEAYAGNVPYYLVKSSVRALGRAMGAELTEHGCTGLSVTPGYLRSEAMLENFGVTEESWRDAIAQDPDYAISETPQYVGRAVAALAADPRVERFAGQTLTSWGLMHEYGFTDVDGSRPDWGRWGADTRKEGMDRATHDAAGYR